MTVDYYQINAFSKDLFGGNPAGVCPLKRWLPTDVMQSIALENNLAETAFFVPHKDHFQIRWFTPEIEMDLCGHATLASAYVLRQFLKFAGEIKYTSVSGDLMVSDGTDSQLIMNFPARIPQIAPVPPTIVKGLNVKPQYALKARDYILVYPDESTILNIIANPDVLNTINIDPGAIVVTAPGDQVDFVSRVFTPQASVFEDPITGSTHCSLIPYWSDRLGKQSLSARQLSARGGFISCQNRGHRVLIGGHCTTFLEGKIQI